MKTKSRSLSVVLALLALCTLNSPLSTAQAQVTAFSYSGQLNYAPPPGNISAPANGTYNLQFTLYNNSAGTGTMGNGMLAQASYPGVVINNGLFTQTVDFGTPSPFNGQSCWLQIGVEGPSDTGFQQQTPLQQVLSTPYAMYATTAGTANSVAAANISGPLPAISGASLTSLNASSLTGGTVPQAQLPSSPTFSGTVTATAFQSDGAGDFVAGQDNAASGAGLTVGGGAGNNATGNYGVVGGGYQNTNNGPYSTVGGGYHNTNGAEYATVGGGAYNAASGQQAAVGGGAENTASGFAATVGGGHANNATGVYATVGGGVDNAVGINRSYYNLIPDSGTISGGAYNNIDGTSQGSFIGGGDYSTIQNGTFSTIARRLV